MGGYVFSVTGERCGCESMNVSGDTTSVTCSGWTAADQTCSFEVKTLSLDCGYRSVSANIVVKLSGLIPSKMCKLLRYFFFFFFFFLQSTFSQRLACGTHLQS